MNQMNVKFNIKTFASSIKQIEEHLLCCAVACGSVKRTQNMPVYDHIALKEVCPHGWLVRFLHNWQITRPYSLWNFRNYLWMTNYSVVSKKHVPLKQYFKRFKQQKMTFRKLLG